MVYLVAGICVLNVIMWIIFGIKFKKIFSPDGMIEKARTGMNTLLRSMQKNTMDNVNLVNETIQKLEQAKIAAERKVDQLNRKLELIQTEENMSRYQSSLHETVRQVPKHPQIDPNVAYEVKTPVQSGLFDDLNKGKLKVIQPEDEVHITSSGASYKEVPVISAPVFDENLGPEMMAQDVPKVAPKKSREEQVMYLFRNGQGVSEIASSLKMTEVEVQFIIDLN